MEDPGPPSGPQHSPALSCPLKRICSLPPCGREQQTGLSRPAPPQTERAGGGGREPGGLNPHGSSGDPGAQGLWPGHTLHSLGAQTLASLGKPAATWGTKGLGPQV